MGAWGVGVFENDMVLDDMSKVTGTSGQGFVDLIDSYVHSEYVDEALLGAALIITIKKGWDDKVLTGITCDSKFEEMAKNLQGKYSIGNYDKLVVAKVLEENMKDDIPRWCSDADKKERKELYEYMIQELKK